MVGRGGEDVRGRVEIEVDADVVEDDGVKHDVFVSAASVGDLGNWESDALGEGRCCTGAKG